MKRDVQLGLILVCCTCLETDLRLNDIEKTVRNVF